ncbi:Alpha/Beta hydrolase protein [Colletotrichum navitas]|uniref:Alpha/Beta hydrolase protein n=1 Tax=Colletotrichum navitas TaxID=681940 RepID=A0AAD8Q4J2_9PEZI|nr:Alpha/Beta hydrolase protein [Colletotrichum navitas]KAK1594704.1 Alpha/Beta hydrolase protein [Colletotrichum navitas]
MALFRPHASTLASTLSFSSVTRRTYSLKTLNLSYDFHEPSKPGSGPSGSPIIFLHGLFGSKKNNRTISKVLARDLGRPVYALDLRNHGESPHDRQHDYLHMADDVAGFIDQHNLEQPTVIGHSMGAKAAMTLALKSPELVQNIVAVDNAPVDAVLESSFSKYIQALKKIEAADITRQAEADRILQEYETSLPIRQFLLGNLYRPEPSKPQQKFRVPLDVISRSLNHMGDFPFKDPTKARFEKPALFVRGTKSKYVPDDVLPIIGQFFPKFRLVDLDAGHWCISEKPEEFRQAVVEFLKEQE